MRKKLVLVEDDSELNRMYSEFLTNEGFSVTALLRGSNAIQTILEVEPDVVILDIMLPDIDGIQICREIQQVYQCPIIMLTAKDDDFIEVTTLQQGADRYLTKPIRLHVLLANIQASLRFKESPTHSVREPGLTVQDLCLDKEAFRITQSGRDLELTTAEFEVMALLMESAGLPVNREQLYQSTRGIEYDGLDRAIDLRISTLRKKLSDEDPPYRYIKTVRGKGYLLSKR